MIDIKVAHYYSVGEEECLTHTEYEDAIEEYFDGFYIVPGENEDIKALIAEHTPLTLIAYNPKNIDEDWLKDLADCLLQEAAERFGEEYGDPDGSDDGLTPKAIQESLPGMTEALKRFLDKGRIWSCDEVDRKELTAEDVEAVLCPKETSICNNLPAS